MNPLAQPGRRVPSATNLSQLAVVCWCLLLVGFVLPLSIIVISSHRPPDGDFAGFYSLGRIVNTHPLKDIYDFDLLMRICNEVHPRLGLYGPLPYPPQVALFFAPFARLPYPVAYVLWLLVSLALYAAGLKLLADRFFPLDPPRRSLLFCMAFSYGPFIVDTAASGQLAAVGFFALSLTLIEDDAGNYFRSGLALSLCTYKPTLLVLLLPMLLVTRRFKTLLGFTAGAAALSIPPTLAGGFGIWPDFFASIFSYGKSASGAQASAIRLLAKYIDISSFSAMVHGGRSWAGLAIMLTFAAAALVSLLWFWWRAPRSSRVYNSLVWAATIAWTLLLNLYVPIYDSILVVLSLIVTAWALKQIPGNRLHREFTLLWILILAGSWFTVLLVRFIGFQALTLLIATLGILQFVALIRLSRPESHPA